MTTTNLGMTLPVVGADSDAWGGELNTMFNTLDALLGGAIYGLTLSTAGSSATFSVAAGAASGMALASSINKTTSSWAVGTNLGGLDTGAISNSTWYYVWLIQRPDTGVIDVLISLSKTAPTMPTNYTRKRRIGAIRTTAGGLWYKFIQVGDLFLWDTPFIDYNASVSGVTTQIGLTPTLPAIQIDALITWVCNAGAGVGNNYVSSPDIANVAAGAATAFTQLIAAGAFDSTELRISTSTGAINARFASTDTLYFMCTKGWYDRRGQ